MALTTPELKAAIAAAWAWPAGHGYDWLVCGHEGVSSGVLAVQRLQKKRAGVLC